MFRSRSTRAAAVAVAAVALFAAACSSSSSSSSSTTAAKSTTTTLPSAKIPVQAKLSSVASLVPAAVASTGQVTFAMDATYPPDEFVQSGSSTIVGMDADLATAIAETMGLKPVLQNVTFDAIIPGLQANKYNVGISSFTDTLARQKVVDFVNYYNAGEQFYVASGTPTTYTQLSSLCGHAVSVESGTVEETDAHTASTDCTKAGHKPVSVLSFSTQDEANLAVSSGRAEVGFADSPVAAWIVQQSGGTFKLSGKPFNDAPYGIALPKGTGMTQAVQASVKALVSNGTYGDILKKWNMQSGAVTLDGVTINGATS